jgi:hypothetical protein
METKQRYDHYLWIKSKFKEGFQQFVCEFLKHFSGLIERCFEAWCKNASNGVVLTILPDWLIEPNSRA